MAIPPAVNEPSNDDDFRTTGNWDVVLGSDEKWVFDIKDCSI